MAPKAPIGAAFTIMAMIRNSCALIVDAARDALAGAPHRQAQAEQDRDQQHLQRSRRSAKAPTTVSGMIAADRRRTFDLLALLGGTAPRHCALAGAPPKPAPGCTSVSDEKADHQRDGGDHLEIDQRLDADAADFLGVAEYADAG